MHRLVLLAAAAAAVPALASGDAPGTIVAHDFYFANEATGSTTITIAPGETVTFTYREGSQRHDVSFADAAPSGCNPPLPAAPARAPWTATCTFAAAGTYDFVCTFHPEMVGRVSVESAPTPSPTRTPTATRTPTPTPADHPPPTPAPPAQTTPAGAAASSPAVRRRQRGCSVRGSITVAQAGSRLTVELRARRKRVGRTTKPVAAGRASFTVRLNATGRRSLRRGGRLAVTVRIAVTPPSGAAFTATRKVTLTR